MDSLLNQAVSGDRRALARLITIVERGGVDSQLAIQGAYPLGGNSYIVGVTGAPGSGKSTLTNALCSEERKRKDKVAVLAIDPSSPFSGGAILGDRVRMEDQAADPGVFVRSLASRGHLGGLSVATPGAAEVLDAAGYELVVVETVGVGQAEVEIMGMADTCVVVLNPGWGDSVQANKAGLMEIADVFVVNKADRAGAGDTIRDVTQMLMIRPEGGWVPPVVAATATEGEGISEVSEAITSHRDWLAESGEGVQRIRRRTATRLSSLVSAELARRTDVLTDQVEFDALVDQIVERETDPWSAALKALSSL